MGRRRAKRSFITGMFLLLLALILIAIIAITFLTYSVVENSFSQQITAGESKMLESANEHMHYLLKDMENLSGKVYVHRGLRDVLSSNTDLTHVPQGDLDPAQNYLDGFFADYQLLYQSIRYDVYVLGDNGYRRRYSSYSSASTNLHYEDVIETPWYQRVLEKSGQPLVIAGRYSGLSTMEERILYTRLLKNLTTDQPTGIFILSFSDKVFSYIYRTLLDDEYAKIALVQSDGMPVWGDAAPGLSQHLPLMGNSGLYRHTDKTGSYQVLYDRIDGTDWYALRTLDLDLLFSFTLHLKIMVVVLCLLCAALAFFFSVKILRRLYRPVDALLTAMDSMQLGGHTNFTLDTRREDEFGLLNRGFVDMAQRLDLAAIQLQKEQEQKRQAEIHALQAQIRPHFLYNTLTSIRCVVGQGNKETAQRMIIALVKLLKGSLSGSEFFSLSQEIDLLRSYALIYQIRYANFDIDYCVEDSALTCLVPRLILQPLVENSIIHGLGDGDGSLSIRIYAYRQGDRLIIDVTDDGVGFSPQARQTLTDAQGRVTGQTESVGLRNVAQRISLSFGAQYDLSLIDADQPGARLRLTLPAITEKEA